MRSLCIGALLFLGSPFSESQTPPPPTAGGNSPNIPLNGPDDRFFLYEAPSNGVGAVGSFVHDTPAVITEAPYSGLGTTSATGKLGNWGTATETVKIRYLRDGQGRMRSEDVSHPRK
jgi:hypothetical protein